MPRVAQRPGIPTSPDWLPPGGSPSSDSHQRFAGFALPTSNTTYTPNQFFDACLPRCSRGAVRLVAYLIRRTLGWCDADGNPRESQIYCSYNELIEHGGVSRDMIRRAIDEAMAGHLIECVRAGRPARAGEPGVTALYQLKWDGRPEYVKDPKRFRGFFEGEGNRTDIPNQFFDHVVPNEPLSVVKVVGSVIRFSIGFQERRGRRRQQARLSYRQIQGYARITSPAVLNDAIRRALARGYIVRVEDGRFDPDAGRRSRPATYSLRWADTPLSPATGDAAGQKPVAAGRSENRSGGGRKGVAADRSAIRSDIQITPGNETPKQQQARVAAAAGEEGYRRLREAGFDAGAAARLAKLRSAGRITDQVRWLPLRSPGRNPLGLLRRAIEEDWPEPRAALATSQVEEDGPGIAFGRHFYAGYGGNDADPTAEISRTEREAADRYVGRLLTVWPDEQRVAGWGRAFAAFVRDRQPPHLVPSLAPALRHFGDAFFARHRAARQNEMEKARLAVLAAREAALTPDWLAYLREREDRVRRDRRDDYAAFAAHRQAERERVRTSRWVVDRDAALARFDAEGQRLRAFQQFFPGDALDFRAWDRARGTPSSPSGRPSINQPHQPFT